MIRIEGGGTQLCDGVTRRELLRFGGIGALGLWMHGVADLRPAEAGERAPGFGRAKSLLFISLFGGPSHQDIWDLKPDAPAEVRGEFKPIRTNVPGIEICEHLPLCAKIADKYCLVRSVTHPRDDHEGGSHVMATGWNTWPQGRYPMYGTIVQKLVGYEGILPPHVHLPEAAQPYSGGDHYLAKQDLPFT